MKWRTIEQAREAGMKGSEEALLESTLHWYQVSTAKKKELMAKLRESDEQLLMEFHCALCFRYKTTNCIQGGGNCCLYTPGSLSCCFEWRIASLTLKDYIRASRADKPAAWEKWQCTSKVMYQRLVMECKKAGVDWKEPI